MERVSLALNRILHYVGGMALVVLMFLTVSDVFGRYAFNRPVRGTFELTELAMVVIVFLALGYAQHHKDHVSMDLVYELVPRAWRRVMDLVSTLLYLAVVVLMTWQLYVYSGRMLKGGYVTGVLRLPIQPVVLLALVGSFAFVLAVFVSLFSSDTPRGGADA